MVRGFARDTPLSKEEIEALQKIELHPELVGLLGEWDTLCDMMDRSNQYLVSNRRHKLVAKYTNVLNKYEEDLK